MANKPTPDFQTFWDQYGLKRDRIAAERTWNRLSARDRRAAVGGIAVYREECQRRGISMMYGQGYLSHRRWEDEPTEPVPTSDAVASVSVQSPKVKPSPTPQPLTDEVLEEMLLW